MKKRIIKKQLIFIFVFFFIFVFCTCDHTKKNSYHRIVREGLLTLDPSAATEANAYQLLLQVAEGLVKYEDHQITSAIAEKWEISEDNKEYRFYINPKAMFSNGRRISAKDVLLSFESILSVDDFFSHELLQVIKGARSFQKGKTQTIEGIKVVDDYTIQINLIKPFSIILDLLTTPPFSILPKESLNKIKREKICAFVSSGPFFIKIINNDKIVLEKNKFYYDAQKVFFDYVYYDVVSDFEKAKKDFIDGKYNDIWPVQIDEQTAQKSTNIKKIPLYSSETCVLAFNQSHLSVVQNINFRKFISKTINPEGYLKKRGLPNHYRSKNIIPKGLPGYNKNVLDEKTESPIELLNKTNCSTNDPCEIEVIMSKTQSDGASELFKGLENYKDKVKLKLTVLERTEYYRRVNVGDYQMYLNAYYPEYFDAYSLLKYFVDPNLHPGVQSKKVTELIDESFSINDRQKRAQIYSQIDADLCAKYYFIPLYHGSTTGQYVKKDVEGYSVSVLGEIDLRVKGLMPVKK